MQTPREGAQEAGAHEARPGSPTSSRRRSPAKRTSGNRPGPRHLATRGAYRAARRQRTCKRWARGARHCA